MVSLFRKIELTSSWVQGGFCELAAILIGRRKQEMSRCSCSTYSSSASTIRKTRLRSTGEGGGVKGGVRVGSVEVGDGWKRWLEQD